MIGGCSQTSPPNPSESRDDKVVGVKQLSISKKNQTAVLLRSQVAGGQLYCVSSQGDGKEIAANAWQIMGWSPDGQYLLFLVRNRAEDAGAVSVYNADTGDVREIADAAKFKFLSASWKFLDASWLAKDQIAFAYDPSRASASADGLLVLSVTGDIIQQQKCPDGFTPADIAGLAEPRSAALEALVFTGKSMDNYLSFWNPSGFHLVQGTQGCNGVCVNPAKPEVAIGVMDSRFAFSAIKTVSTQSGQNTVKPLLTASQFPMQTEVTDMKYSPDGSRFLISTITDANQNETYLFNIASGDLKPIINSSIASLSADGSRIIYAESSSVRYRNANTLYSSDLNGSDVKLFFQAKENTALPKIVMAIVLMLFVGGIVWLIQRRRLSSMKV